MASSTDWARTSISACRRPGTSASCDCLPGTSACRGSSMNPAWSSRNFELSYLLSTLQMDPFERGFPGSRFTDAEVDALFGREIAQQSKARLARFIPAMAEAGDLTQQLSITLEIMTSRGRHRQRAVHRGGVVVARGVSVLRSAAVAMDHEQGASGTTDGRPQGHQQGAGARTHRQTLRASCPMSEPRAVFASTCAILRDSGSSRSTTIRSARKMSCPARAPGWSSIATGWTTNITHRSSTCWRSCCPGSTCTLGPIPAAPIR